MNLANGMLEQRPGVEPADLLRDLWRMRLWIVATTVVGLLAAAGIAFISAPIYRVSTVLIPAMHDNSDLPLGGVSLDQIGGLLGIGGAAKSSITNEALAVLRSRQFTERFIVDNDLMPVLFPGEWDTKKKAWRVAPSRQPTLAKAFKKFTEEVSSVVEDKQSGFIILNVDWNDREQAAAWANDLVARLNAEMRQRAIAKSEASLAYLRKELKATAEVSVQEAIGRLIEAQIQDRMLANVSPEYAFRVVDEAKPPDVDDIYSPRRKVLLIGGFVAGLGLGSIGVMLAGMLSREFRAQS